MSVSKWAWTWDCDRGICVGDCDLCDKPDQWIGRWEKRIDNGIKMLECPECECRVIRIPYENAVGRKGFQFCPCCGAKLVKE